MTSGVKHLVKNDLSGGGGKAPIAGAGGGAR